jgi:hypothetical protein
MTFEEILNQALALLQRQGRVSYRALKRQFSLDDAYLEDLKLEIIEIHQVAVDQAAPCWADGGARQPLYRRSPTSPRNVSHSPTHRTVKDSASRSALEANARFMAHFDRQLHSL